MTRQKLKTLRENWYTENAPLGRKLGYPYCCIKEFCDQPPALLQISYRFQNVRGSSSISSKK